jgi:hypothetical protein
MNTDNEPIALASIRQMMDGQQLPVIRAKLAECHNQRRGENSRGEWTLQRGKMTDTLGNSALVVFDNRPDMKAFLGQELCFKASDRGAGIKVKQDAHEGKTRHEIWINKAAVAIQVGAAPPQQQAPPEQNPIAQNFPAAEYSDPSTGQWTNEPRDRQTGQRAPANEPYPQPQDNGQLHIVRKAIMQRANLHLICTKAAHAEAKALKASGIEMSPEQVQATASSIFISADRAGYAEMMPTHPIT